MSNIKISNFSVGSTGNCSITGIPFLPASIEFYIAQSIGTDNVSHFSHGSCNSSSQMAESTFEDTTGGKSESYFDRCINHMARVSGTITDIIKATFVSFDDNGGGDYGFTLNFTAANANYKIYFVARD